VIESIDDTKVRKPDLMLVIVIITGFQGWTPCNITTPKPQFSTVAIAAALAFMAECLIH
jgi:hypothetical protein